MVFPWKVTKTRRLRVWQRFALIAAAVALLCVCATLFMDPVNPRFDLFAGETAADEAGWGGTLMAYVSADEGDITAQMYTEGLSPLRRLGRGKQIELESWTPLVTEDGTEYYHICVDGETGYILPRNVTLDTANLLTETTVYVRVTADMVGDLTDYYPVALAEKGSVLRILGYDRFEDDGTVDHYLVSNGEVNAWIKGSYVCSSFSEALEHDTGESDCYEDHVSRGDSWGGGDAADLEYGAFEKLSVSSQGNVMPDSVYALHVVADSDFPEQVDDYIAYAKTTGINAFVVTLVESGTTGSLLAYRSPYLEEIGLLDEYYVHNSVETLQQALQKLKDEGYYLIARYTCFNDTSLAVGRPEWSLTNADTGELLMMASSYWPSAFSRDVWHTKVLFAVEAGELLGFDEIQFDYCRFPDSIDYYADIYNVDDKNVYGESYAQAIQRFLIYACDVLHEHGLYCSACVYGETSNPYVSSYGQYWPAVSTVVDAISGMPYPDHFSSYYSGGTLYRPAEHPYATLDEWSYKVNLRQQECATPAAVRTWIQIWNTSTYTYDDAAIMREILAMYDNDITGGYMTWNYNGDIDLYLPNVLPYSIDYYTAWQEATAAGMKTSEYLGISTDDTQSAE